MGNKWGFHSGVGHMKDCKISGDLYVQDDIVFSDVSAGTLGVTGGIDMQSTTSAIGIDMGGTFTTSAINIDGTCATDAIKITGIVGTGIYINKTANTAGTLKIHCHQAADGVEYANEFKGEFLSTSGTTDGIAAHYHMSASGTSIMRSILGVAYLDSGITLSGTDYTTTSWIVGGLFSANAGGIVNGSGVVVAGLYGGIASSVGGTLTQCKYLTSIWADSSRLVALSSGQSSLILATNEAGAQNIDYGLRIESANLLTTGISVSGATTTAISLSGDATTGISITNGMSATNVISIAATGSNAGVLISGACGKAIEITGSATTAIGILTGTYTTGLSIAATVTTGISVTGTGATASAKALSTVGFTVNNANYGDGYGLVECDLTLTGASASASALSSWINMTSGTYTGYICAQTNGVYETGATISGASIIFGMRCQSLCTQAPGKSYPFSVVSAVNVITAIFKCNAGSSDMGTTSVSKTTEGKYVPLYEDDAGVHYVLIYN